jgi:hypothetical protein
MRNRAPMVSTHGEEAASAGPANTAITAADIATENRAEIIFMTGFVQYSSDYCRSQFGHKNVTKGCSP